MSVENLRLLVFLEAIIGVFLFVMLVRSLSTNSNVKKENLRMKQENFALQRVSEDLECRLKKILPTKGGNSDGTDDVIDRTRNYRGGGTLRRRPTGVQTGSSL